MALKGKEPGSAVTGGSIYSIDPEGQKQAETMTNAGTALFHARGLYGKGAQDSDRVVALN